MEHSIPPSSLLHQLQVLPKSCFWLSSLSKSRILEAFQAVMGGERRGNCITWMKVLLPKEMSGSKPWFCVMSEQSPLFVNAHLKSTGAEPSQLCPHYSTSIL